MKQLKCEVCGMIINEKNYLINNNGIPEENNIQSIKYCPFCGAAYEYLGDVDEKTIEIKDKKLHEDTIKILDHAMKLEVFNSEFYAQAAELVEDTKVKKMFEDLSRIELIHARVHQRLGGFSNLPVLAKLDYRKYVKADATKDLLEQARNREIHAVEYYKKYSISVEDENIKEIFKALSNVETDHVEMEEKAL